MRQVTDSLIHFDDAEFNPLVPGLFLYVPDPCLLEYYGETC